MKIFVLKYIKSFLIKQSKCFVNNFRIFATGTTSFECRCILKYKEFLLLYQNIKNFNLIRKHREQKDGYFYLIFHTENLKNKNFNLIADFQLDMYIEKRDNITNIRNNFNIFSYWPENE